MEARKTADFDPGLKITYATMGLVGEAGELANKVKKLLRGDDNREELLAGVKSEMGDVLWYLSALADDMGIPLSDIAAENIAKIRDRQSRGKIRGGGDYR
ncbi:MAG: nucleoside triphosphate pyrophosphohydrolase family protein [Alphaproteobacteria bacterium]|nr:nucleoside triphosphate pyrophosphohydrolase family protein [Alphaproteobacteria bacterium]